MKSKVVTAIMNVKAMKLYLKRVVNIRTKSRKVNQSAAQ